ncbi:hypothetical protein BC628DRAFT_1355448 [Trametes gibbosa]|nr:hypothetical protein BC628DRAFT_1355448 [Trametes gibbosa]
MNTTAASRTATAQSVSPILTSVAVFENGALQGCCPVARMFELVRAALRLALIASASVVLALSGMIVSVVALLRQTYERWLGLSHLPHTIGLQHEPNSFPLRDRDRSASRDRRSPSRIRSLNMSRSSSSNRHDGERTPLRSSPEPMYSTEERHRGPSALIQRRVRRQRDAIFPTLDLPSMDSAMEAVESSSLPIARPPLDVLTDAASKKAVRALSSPAQLHTDSSPVHSTDSSIALDSTEEIAKLERSPSHKHVLQCLKDHHNQFRERCLVRVPSPPNAKPVKQARRTDPYEAPYYFPTPLSPDVDIYVQQVRSERQASQVTDTITSRQHRDSVSQSPRTSPKSTEHFLPPIIPEHPVQELQEPAAPPVEPRLDTPTRLPLREKTHRWSWHLPHIHSKAHHDEPERREGSQGGAQSALPAKFLFRHHRRRHGTASEDLRDKPTSVPPRA